MNKTTCTIEEYILLYTLQVCNGKYSLDLVNAFDRTHKINYSNFLEHVLFCNSHHIHIHDMAEIHAYAWFPFIKGRFRDLTVTGTPNFHQI